MMGLGFEAKAEIKGRGLLRKRPGRDRVFGDIIRAIQDNVSDPLMKRLLRIDTAEHKLFFTPHPAAESVEFLWAPEHSVRVSAKTSGVGPGYHAFLVDLMDDLSERLDLRWDWADADETGYVSLRDFSALQDEMAGFLKSLAAVLLDTHSSDPYNLMVNMSISNPRPVSEEFSSTPLGPLSIDWWRAVQDTELPLLEEKACQFYPWWHRQADAIFWKRTAEVLMWFDVPWRKPDKDSERSTIQLALDCLMRAQELDHAIALPGQEIEELRQLLVESDGPPCPPRVEGIGYRRGLMCYPTTEFWTINLPGYFHYDVENDGQTCLFWFADRTVRVSSLSAEAHKDKRHVQARDILPEKTPESIRGGDVIDIQNDRLIGWATIFLNVEEQGSRYWILHGYTACDNSLCLLTICFDNPSDRDWATEVFKSISRPDPQVSEESPT